MNIDYSSLKERTTNIPSYGSGAYKKDTLVKYLFKTPTDEHGNKVMDKMSREEPAAMKDIPFTVWGQRIVEFSGDACGSCGGRQESWTCRKSKEQWRQNAGIPKGYRAVTSP